VIDEAHRCGRPTASTKKACRAVRLFPFPACVTHLNVEERAKYEEDKAKQRAFWEPYVLRRAELLLSDPACWSWPTTPTSESAPLPEEEASELLHTWQEGRCAICGNPGDLVNDHDHQTGLIRGLLCRQCNTNEGMDGRPWTVYQRFREKHPAMILGIRLRYWDPIAKAYAQPARQIEDGWDDNAAAGLT
jgi:hypothetical protein